jgi:hypothetical protein
MIDRGIGFSIDSQQNQWAVNQFDPTIANKFSLFHQANK